MIRTPLFAAVAVAAIGSITYAQQFGAMAEQKEEEVKPLTIGDPARPIEITHWIKGDKVEEFAPDKVYVLEFWATWCPPCRDSMPHISKLQEKYKDYGVTIIGVSDEELSKVTDFLPKKDKEGKSWDEKVRYTLTTDPDRSVYLDYMKAAGQGGIPTAFIIGKDQRIEWIGHPMQIDKPLDSVVKDTWDRAAFKRKFENQKNAERDFRQFMTLLVRDNKPDEAYETGEKLLTSAWDDAQMLNMVAWTVVDNPMVQKRNLDFAYKAAKRAVELTNNEDAANLDTLARVYYEKGDLNNAVLYQKKAVEHAPEGQMGDEIKEVLKKYQDELASKKN